MDTRNFTITAIPATFKAGIWDGLTDEETNYTLAYKVIAAYGILFATPVSPFIAATIPVIGLKNLGKGSYYLSTSLFSLFYHLADNKKNVKEVELAKQSVPTK